MSCGKVWEQRTFYVDCKLLHKNSNWWHQLSLLGILLRSEKKNEHFQSNNAPSRTYPFVDIHFDDNKFRLSQNGDYQRTLVPLLLQKTSMDIQTALDFGRAYLIEGSVFVSLTSISASLNIGILNMLLDDFVLFEYVKLLLPLAAPFPSFQSPNPTFGGEGGSSSSREDLNRLERIFYPDFSARIAGVVEDIDNKEKLLSLLKKAVDRASPYHYECNLLYHLLVESKKQFKKLDQVSNFCLSWSKSLKQMKRRRRRQKKAF